MAYLICHELVWSPHVAAHSRRGSGTAVLQHRPQLASTTSQQALAPTRTFRMCATNISEPVTAEDVNPNDPELQKQIDAILRELDPDFLLEDTRELLTNTAVADSQQEQQQQQQAAEPSSSSSGISNMYQADAWQEMPGDEETESGLPDGVVLTRAEYKRKAAVLVEFITALQQGESAQEAFEQKLSSFRVEIDEALLHMLAKRIEAAKTLAKDQDEVQGLQDLYDVLRVEHERAAASPALRLLDECLDILGDDPYLPGARERAEQVVQRLRSAFTGGAAANIDIFAAAAALAADKALAADALAVEFVPQVLFLQEGMELLQQAKDEMQQISSAVLDAQMEIQKARNANPQLLESPEAKQHMQQVAAADAALQRRKAAIGQLTYVLDIAQDLDAAEQSLTARQDKSEDGDMENLAALLGVE